MPKLLAALLLLTLIASAQTTPRATIGLVLEGGGALGFAHIGVLQWLEDHRIPVDYVAGTSMGGLIGGLYASGQRPAEIRELARAINWDKTLSGVVEFQDLNFRRKEDRVNYPNRLAVGLKGGLALPGGLNSGEEIGLILDRAVLPYYNLRSFDDLPIPFRCVATEMVSGKQTIFDHGSLATALRSTMSIPTVFSPVPDGDKLYTDGGALNNLPVDVAKAMGADIVIAVFLNPGADDPKMFNSLLGSAGRNIAIMIAANEVRSMQQADVLLSADLKGFTATDFSKSEEIYPKGIAAAAQKAALLDRFALPEAEWPRYLRAREAKRRTTVPVPEFISVKGASPELKPGVERLLSKYVGDHLNPDLLDADLRRLTGNGYFDSVGYNMEVENQKDGLAIHAVEKTYAPPFLNLSVNVDGTDTNDIRFGLAVRATFMDLGGYKSELRVEGFFGAYNGLRTEYFHPFSKSSKWFVAPRLYLTNRNFEVYEDQKRISQYRIGDSGAAVDLGYSLSRRAEFRIGEALDWERGTLLIGSPVAPNGSRRRGISSAHFRYLGHDDGIIPRKGLNVQTDYNYFSTGYSSTTAKVDYFQPVSAKGSVFVTGAFGSAFGAKGLGGDSFALGGPLSLGAFGRNELLGNQYYLAQTGYLRELFKLNPIIGDAIYAIAYTELGKVYAPVLPNTPKNPWDASGVVVIKTLVGPAYVGASAGEGGRRKWWFGIGQIF